MKQINNYITEKLHLGKNTNIEYSCQPKYWSELRTILKGRLNKDKNADFNDIDVSNISNMNMLFYDLDPHNIHIENWDVSNVTNMSDMFFRCENFNCNLSNWDVSHVQNMRNMFNGCTSLKNKPSWYKS